MRALVAQWLLLFSLHVGAQQTAEIDVELPPGVLGLSDTINIFRSPFKRKFEELSESYIVRSTDSTIHYQAAKDVVCFYRGFAAGAPLVRAIVSQETKPNYLRETIIYDDCWAPRSLVEEIVTRGGRPRPATLRQISRGERQFNLSADVQEIFYRLSNADGEGFLTFNIKRVGASGWRASFALLSNPVLNINFEEVIKPEMLERRWSWSFPSASVQYARPMSRWNSNYGLAPTLQVVQELARDSGEIRQTRYLTQGALLSQQDFQQQLQEQVSAKHARLDLARQFVSYHLISFPSTEFVGSIGPSQRLLNELRLANIRLLGNTDIALVHQLVQSLIQAIEKGLISIEDRRP